METYGVSFANYKPNWGELDELLTTRIIPSHERSLALARKNLAECRNVMTRLQKMRELSHQVCTGCDSLIQLLKEKIEATNFIVEDIVCPEEAPKSERKYYRGLMDGVEKFDRHAGDVAVYFDMAADNFEAELVIQEAAVTEIESALVFWRSTMSVSKIDWIFDQAEVKFRTKICREAVKELSAYIDKGKAYIKWMNNSTFEQDYSTSIELAEKLLERAEQDLENYKMMKRVISEVGVAEASRRWDGLRTEIGF